MDSCRSSLIGVSVLLLSTPIHQLTTREDVLQRTLWVVDYQHNVILKYKISIKVVRIVRLLGINDEINKIWVKPMAKLLTCL
jgi:hypothetical protein